MAITVNIYYRGVNGNARKFAEEMVASGVVGDIRGEEGNIRYEYFFPMDDQETVLLIDSWRDQQSLDAHHASPMMGKITGLREKYDLHMKVERYVTDEAGVPASDRAFIREEGKCEAFFKMPSDELAGDAKRRVPLPLNQEEGKCEAFFKMPSDELAGDAKRRVPLPLNQEEGKCEAFFKMPSDELAGDAKRRVPLPLNQEETP